MSKVAIIGSGFVGRAWAISFSRAGLDVALWDQDPQAPERALTIFGRCFRTLKPLTSSMAWVRKWSKRECAPPQP